MLEGSALHRGSEYNRRTGCGKTARPGLYGGCRVTGIPTVEAGGGSIINISSIGGLVGFGPSSGAYAASKGAVRLLTKSTATQYAKDGIRCNSVHPGFIDTPMTARSLSVSATREDRIWRTPLGRIGTSEDIASGVLYLASDESSFVTGSELVIDGGYTAQ